MKEKDNFPFEEEMKDFEKQNQEENKEFEGKEQSFFEEEEHLAGGRDNPAVPEDYVNPDFYRPTKTDNGKFFGLGIASMVLGIVSVVCCCLFGAPILLAVLAIVFAILRMTSKADGFSVAGLVTGIIGLIFNALMLVLMLSGDTDFDIPELESLLESLEGCINLFFRR